jgi:hypothetical protein
MMRFEDVQEGDELPTRELFLAKDQVRAYARAANQWSPRFTDDEGERLVIVTATVALA